MDGIVSGTMNTTRTKQGRVVTSDGDGGPGSGKILTVLLAEAIRNSGLSMETVADRADMSRQYLYSIISGAANPTIEMLGKAFEATGTPLERLLDDKALYGRDKLFHDRVQSILNQKGTRAVALQVIVDQTYRDGK